MGTRIVSDDNYMVCLEREGKGRECGQRRDNHRLTALDVAFASLKGIDYHVASVFDGSVSKMGGCREVMSAKGGSVKYIGHHVAFVVIF